VADEMGLFDAIYHTRAMRRLKTDPVPEELLVRLIEAAHQAPSGSNQQNGRWLMICDAEQKRKLAELNKVAVTAYAAASNSQAAPLAHQSIGARQRMLNSVVWQADHLAEIPAIVIACLELGEPRRETFFAGAGAGGSIWPGVQNLLLAARALGLGAAPTTLGLQNRAAVKAILTLPETIEPFCLIPIGYPMGKFGPVSRRPVQEILRWDRWD
jgi:nitroreductase